MAFLVNRTPAARLQCLQYLVELALNRFGNEQFRLNDLLFDEGSINIHNFCKLLIEDKTFKIKYCPYLRNPLSKSGCYLTKSISEDTTKRKEVSNTANSLDALGFFKRENQSFRTTDLGKQFAELPFYSRELLQVIRKGVLNYGLVIGILFQLRELQNSHFDTNQVLVGYPDANEKILVNGELVNISVGSQRDSNTRTKSCLLAWLTTAGYILPDCLENKYNKNNLIPQKLSSDYILGGSRNRRKYKIIELPNIFNGNFVVQRPLDYNNLIKNIRALRENGQELSRQTTMKFEHIVKNRRFAILYCLNQAFKEGKVLNFDNLINAMVDYPEFFVIEKKNLRDAIMKELPISLMAGIPYISAGRKLKPMVGLNEEIFYSNAPQEILDLIKNKIIEGYNVLSI